MLFLICDKCGKSKPETICSYYYDDEGMIGVICFACQPKSPA